jgi:hypothetical protein
MRHGIQEAKIMGTPVQITVSVDPSGGVTGFQQIGGAATTMGQQISTAGLKGQAAVDALTKAWNDEQAAIAAVNARMKENMAVQDAADKAKKKALEDEEAAAAKAAKQFQGMTSEQMKASVAGRLLEQTLGLQNRALNQVISRSAVLGPLMASLFPVAIWASVLPMAVSEIEKIGQGIANAAQAAGGMTEAVKQMNAETIQASQDAFINPRTMDAAREHLNIVISEITANDKLKDSAFLRVQKVAEESTFMQQLLGITDYRVAKEMLHNSAIDKGVQLTKEQLALLDKIAELNRQAAIDQTVTTAFGSGLHGFSKLQFDEAVAIKGIQDDKSLDAEQREIKEYAVHYEFSQKRIQLLQSEADKTIALRHQVEDQTLHGTTKMLADETAAVAELTRLHQRNGTDDQQFQQQKVLIHQRTLNEIAAFERQAASDITAIQDRTRDTFLSGEDLVLAHQSEAVSKARAEYERAPSPSAWQKYQAEIVLADAVAQAAIRASRKATEDQAAADLAARTLEITKLKEEQVNAQTATALAAVAPWQKAYQQIYDAENASLLKIQKDQDSLKVKYADDAGMLVQIDATAQAERVRVYAETNEKIRAENLHLTEQLGSDLQSVFDDISSGNIGKRILANMEKMFFQIVAQWILSLNMMKSAAGSIFGSIVFGPQSTGANVFGGGGGGGGGSILGSLFGGSSGGSSSGGALSAPPPGINDPGFGGFGLATSTSGLSGAIAGTSATSGSPLAPSASNALTTSTIANALGSVGSGGGGVASGGGKAGGLSSLFSAGSLASLAGLGLATTAGALGGKTGQVGGLLMGLLMSGKLGGVISSLYGSIGLAGTGALVGGLTGGLVGFGVGQSSGGILGSLAGAGSGALSGFLVGGPVGALVGGIIGLLGGIFGGIFGGSKRAKQANALADNTLLPDITQISTGFDGFQIDSNSAIQQLEKLRTDSQTQLSALKSQGKDVFNSKVNPAIDAAEKHIRDTQTERDSRSAQMFGPPQFDTGGMFSVMRGNAGLAVLHDGEMVINPTATKKNLPDLLAMNAGRSPSSRGGDTHLHIHAIDAKSFDAWAKNGGARMMARALTRHWDVEGNS